MDGSTITARLRYLNSAAALYAQSTPATSSYLMHERIKVADENEVQTSIKETRHTYCTTCGTIFADTEGDAAKVLWETDPSNGPRASLSEDIGGHSPELKSKCSVCHRPLSKTLAVARKPVPPQPLSGAQSEIKVPSDKHDIKASKPLQELHGGASTRCSGKQRAKARKQGALQASVDRSKHGRHSNAAAGLDLMDFMKAV